MANTTWFMWFTSFAFTPPCRLPMAAPSCPNVWEPGWRQFLHLARMKFLFWVPGDSVSKQKIICVFCVLCDSFINLIVSVASCGFASYFLSWLKKVTQLSIFSDETNGGPNDSIFRQTSLWSWGGSWRLIRSVSRCLPLAASFFNTLSYRCSM